MANVIKNLLTMIPTSVWVILGIGLKIRDKMIKDNEN
jgi:hypothetical protein